MKQKKNSKKVDLCIPQVDDVLLPGKFICQCHGMTHKLINNCINCGRIICEQEGEGPCQTCGQIVSAKIGGKGVKGTTREIDEQFPEFNINDNDQIKAIAHKDKMLSYDKSNFANKNVFDEQTDWYQVADDVWQGKETRSNAVNKLFEKQDQIYENQKGIHLSYQPDGWVEEKKEFDENAFIKEAQLFVNSMISQEAEKNQSNEMGSRLREKEKEIYEDIKKQISEISCIAKENKTKENKNVEKKEPNNQSKRVPRKIVQLDDFYTSFV